MTPDEMLKVIGAAPITGQLPQVLPDADFTNETLKRSQEESDAERKKNEEERRAKIDERKEIISDLKKAKKDKSAKSYNEAEIFVKFNKLKMAKKIAVSALSSENRRNAVIDDASDLIDNIETKIKSIALSKYAIRKESRIKSLGKTREELETIIDELEYVNEGYFEKLKNNKLGFGLDKRFLGLSVDEILEKVNFAKSDVEENVTVPDTDVPNIPAKTNTPEVNVPTQVELYDNVNKETIPVVGSDIDERVTTLETDVHDIYDHLTDNRNSVVNNTSSFKDKEIETDTIGINTNKANEEFKVQANNEKIYEYLVRSGEFEAADFILDLMTKPDEIKNTSDIKENTEAIIKLSKVNTDIYDTLVKIEENMIDEQDTSIDAPKVKEKQQLATIQEQKTEERTDWLSKIGDMLAAFLESFFGKNIFKLIQSAKGKVAELSMSLIRPILPFLGQALVLGASAYAGYKIGQTFFQMIGTLDDEGDLDQDSMLAKFNNWLSGMDEVSESAKKSTSFEDIRRMQMSKEKKRWETISKLNKPQVESMLHSYYKNSKTPSKEIVLMEKRAKELDIDLDVLKKDTIQSTSSMKTVPVMSTEKMVPQIVEPNKEKTMQKTEQNYTKVITATNVNEIKKVKNLQLATSEQNLNINNVNSKAKNVNTFEIFENLNRS